MALNHTNLSLHQPLVRYTTYMVDAAKQKSQEELMNQPLLEGFGDRQTITGIEVVTGNPLLRRIKIGRKTIATLPVDDVAKLGIATGALLTDKLASVLEQAVMMLQVRKTAQRLIKRRAYSRGELNNKLQATCSNSLLIEMVVDELCETGAIDDEAYAQNIAMSLTQRGPISQSQLVQKLCKRCINPKLALQIAQQALSEIDPIEAAISFARKRMKSMQSKSHLVKARRICGALARRGFDWETIRIVMNKVGLDIAEHTEN